MSLTAGQHTVATDGTHIATDGVKRYVALLTQTGTDAPVAIVLENSLGGVLVWSYGGVGIYDATLVGAFAADKTFLILPSGSTDSGPGDGSGLGLSRISNDVVRLLSRAGDSDMSTNTSIEIRVYP
jgi:hypothetical protein